MGHVDVCAVAPRGALLSDKGRFVVGPAEAPPKVLIPPTVASRTQRGMSISGGWKNR